MLRHSLGNLLALSQRRNSKFSNRPFATKKQDADGATGYSNGSYSEIAVAKLPDWTPTSVIDRGLSMLDFLEKRWAVSLGPRKDKLALLNLGFLEPVDSAKETANSTEGGETTTKDKEKVKIKKPKEDKVNTAAEDMMRAVANKLQKGTPT